MNEKEIKEYVEKGYIRVSVIFEIVGKPQKHVEETIKAYVANIKTNEEIKVIKEEYEPAEDAGEDLFSTIAEVEMLLENMDKLTWLAINFTPASIEVIEPATITVEQREITHWMNDLLARLHEMGMIQKAVRSQTETLIRNFNSMTRNAILLVLREGAEIGTVSQKIGMSDEHTQKFLDALLKEKKIKKEGNSFYLV
ncbi:hypothetical protein JXA48_04780 [Candidatus Woesearchaeota archaeon]|nr:hypothetical protein [Candidatus Woesearchaeota archaeon]